MKNSPKKRAASSASLAKDIMRDIYPDVGPRGLSLVPRYTLDEVRLAERYSEITPHNVDLSMRCGSITLNLPLISAAMDTVFSAPLAKALFEVGACGIAHYREEADEQLGEVKQVLQSEPCIIRKPKCLKLGDKADKALRIQEEDGFSTIPVINEQGILAGVIFSKNIPQEQREKLVEEFMTPIKIITSVEEGIGFFKVKEKMLTEAGLTCLPVLDRQGILKGIYFRKDCRPAQPAYHNNKPLVGMAISVKQNDLERAEDAMKIGVGKIVIDSSHGDCPAVIEQAKRLVSLRDKLDCQTAIIAGNVGSIDGYLRLAEAGVDAVKVGIGSGSICTTSLATGVGVPMFSLIRECFYAKKYLRQHNKKHAPLIIADGGINFTGQIVLALAAGASLCMGGQYFVAAQESKGAIEKNCKEGDLIPYRGMASLEAIKARLSARYGEQKRAAEGVSGFEPCRGPLKKWIGNDSELIAGGFSHVGAGNIEELHKICDSDPYIFSLITSAGQQQMQTRVIME